MRSYMYFKSNGNALELGTLAREDSAFSADFLVLELIIGASLKARTTTLLSRRTI